MNEGRMAALERAVARLSAQLATIERLVNRATCRRATPLSQPSIVIRWGVAQADWTAFGEVDVLICRGPMTLPISTGTTVHCQAPGVEGDKCTIGLVIPVKGLDEIDEEKLTSVFLPLECAVSLDTDSSGNCVLGEDEEEEEDDEEGGM